MGVPRKQALKQIKGKSVQIERHMARIEADPLNRSGGHWRSEVASWIVQILNAAPATGEKTEADILRRIAGWRQRLEQLYGDQ